MKESSQQYWNSVANSWERFGDLNYQVEKYVGSKITKHLNLSASGQILNLGSGGGDRYLSGFKDRVVHVDYALNMLRANKLGQRVEADARVDLPFSGESFENIVSFFLMRYLSLEQQLVLIKNATKLLKKGGKLLVVDIPDNNHQFQVSVFDPETLVADITEDVIILESQTEVENVGKYISTGFGGWYEQGSYKISVLAIQRPHK